MILQKWSINCPACKFCKFSRYNQMQDGWQTCKLNSQQGNKLVHC